MATAAKALRRAGGGRSGRRLLVRPARLARRAVVAPRRGSVARCAAADGGQDHARGTGVAGALGRTRETVARYVRKLDGLWSQLVPMGGLFFLMAFVNTLLDSTKDTLVITATGGGVEQIPFLVAYAVLPSSFLFLLCFSSLANRLSRNALFAVTIAGFAAFFALFAGVLFPLRDVLHPHAFADSLMERVWPGFVGAVMVLRNWTYTLFYVFAELWGDVCLSLLFWGLANESTRLVDAPLLYPLFGLGANVAQALAGALLRGLGGVLAAHTGADVQSEQVWGLLVSTLMGITLAACAVIVVVHRGIVRHAKQRGMMLPAPAGSGRSGSGGEEASTTKDNKPDVLEAFKIIAETPQVACLAICAVSQGLSMNLFEFAWKGHLRMLHPTPTEYSAYMGAVASWTGCLTGVLMIVSPIVFSTLGWANAASAMPKSIMLFGSVFFFGALGRASFAHGGFVPPPELLSFIVLSGAIVYIAARSSKFALFKPAEEMVYITLDRTSRTKGKAAIDVVVTQMGKTSGSLVQQVLLLCCAGSQIAILPVIMVLVFAIVRKWGGAISQLAEMRLVVRQPNLTEDPPQGEAVPNGEAGASPGSDPGPQLAVAAPDTAEGAARGGAAQA